MAIANKLKRQKGKGKRILFYSLVFLLTFNFYLSPKLGAAQDNAPGKPVQLVLVAHKQVRVRDPAGGERQEWEELKAIAQVQPGDVIRYTLSGKNSGDRPMKNLVLTQPIPPQTAYVLNSANAVKGEDAGLKITYSIDNGQNFLANPTVQVTSPDGKVERKPAPAESYTHIRWTFGESLGPAAEVGVAFVVRVK